MQQVPADIVRYWNTYGNKTVKEILRECQVNRQLRDALCQSQAFWEGLLEQRLTGEDVIVKGHSIRGMQESLHQLDKVYERLKRLKTYAGEGDTAQERDDYHFVRVVLENIVAKGNRRLVMKILSTGQAYPYYRRVVTALAAGAIQGSNDDLLEEIINAAESQGLHLDAFRLGNVAAQHGRSDIIDRIRAWPQQPDDLEAFDRRVLNSGVKYLATHPNNTQFRDYLLERFLQNQPDLQDDAFIVALKEDYDDFIARYRDTVNPDFLADVIANEIAGGDTTLVHKIIEYIPDQNLPDLLQLAIEVDNVEIAEHILDRLHDNPQAISDAIEASINTSLERDEKWSPAVRELLDRHLTDEQRGRVSGL